MEAALATAAMTQQQESNNEIVEAVMETTSTGITPTNLKQTIHHFNMAKKSLDRSFDLLGRMTDGRSGRVATELGVGITAANAGVVKINDAIDIVDGVLAELEELYS